MSNLWIYMRRPTCVVRYRHGGESAIYPLLKQPIVGTLQAAQAAVAVRSVLADSPVRQEDNVLDFTAAKWRAERSRHKRGPRGKDKPKRRE